MRNKPESTRLFLNDSIFQGLRRKIEIQTELLGKVREAVPGFLAVHCRYCVVREDERLAIFTDSPAWATQLRFHAPSLLAALNAGGQMSIRGILIRNLRLATPKEGLKPMKIPSPQAIEMVKACSMLAACPELGEALARLGITMERYAGKS